MRLTAYTDYSLRVLMYLALYPERLVSTQEISDAFGISNHHLVKVIHNLGAKHFLKVRRGRNGGVSLGRPPEQIRVGDVVRDTETDFRIVECFEPRHNGCRIMSDCRLKAYLGQASKAFLKILDDCTIADLIGQSREKYRRHLPSCAEERRASPRRAKA